MSTAIPSRPEPTEYFEYFDTYISLVPEENILETLENQFGEFESVLNSIPEDQTSVLHAPYTWTIKQVVGHMIDTERVFGYRACRFAAGDEKSLPGFDQDVWVANTDYDQVALPELVEELCQLRHSNIGMFNRMSAEAWQRTGTADEKQMSVRAAAYILVGHIRHHMKIVNERIASC